MELQGRKKKTKERKRKGKTEKRKKDVEIKTGIEQKGKKEGELN